MSEEKKEVLRQIHDIKNHLVDKQIFFPYNYRATYVWAVIALILTFTMIPIYEKSILQGTFVAIFFIAIGFITEGFLTKRENKSYDIEDCTYRQQFIVKTFLMLTSFGIVLSMILASYSLYIPVLLLWLFLCSMGYFLVGFILNIERFSQMAQFNIFSSVLLLGIGHFTHALEGLSNYLIVIQIFMVLGLTLMPSVVAWQQIKAGK